MLVAVAYLGLLAPSTTTPFIAVNNQVIATCQNKAWQPAPVTFGTNSGQLKLVEVGIGKIGKDCSAKGIDSVPEIEGAFLREPTSEADVQACGLNVTIPRPVKQADAKACKKWVAEWVQKQKIFAKQIQVFEAYQADLDGDGKTETIVEAASRKGLGTVSSRHSRTDFSAVLLRVGNKTLTVQSAKGGLNVCALKAIADLDGDGKMEIVSTSAYYEGFTARIHRYEGRKLKMLVENGSGA